MSIPHAQPLVHVEAGARVDYLKRVLVWTAGGLFLSAGSGIAMALLLFAAGSAGITLFFNNIVMLAIILGSYGIAQYVAPRFVFGEAKVLGFAMGAVFQGIAMGYLLLTAVLIGVDNGDPFGLVGTALGLTGLTGVGMAAYVWTSPREFKMLGAALSALFLPMLVLMGVSFVFPSIFGGTLGIVLSAVFVVVSAGGLLFQVNKVIHRLSTDQHIEGAYLITMGVLILYWNILTLLMRLNRR